MLTKRPFAKKGKVYRHNLCKKGCQQPLEKRWWQTAWKRQKTFAKKGVLYPLKKRLCSQQPLEKWQKCDTAFRKKSSQNLWKKGGIMLLQQGEPLQKRHGPGSTCYFELKKGCSCWEGFGQENSSINMLGPTCTRHNILLGDVVCLKISKWLCKLCFSLGFMSMCSRALVGNCMCFLRPFLAQTSFFSPQHCLRKAKVRTNPWDKGSL